MTTQRTQISFAMCLCLVACLLIPALSGCTKVKSVTTTVSEWIISFATETGKFVKEKATTFGEALSAAWKAFWGTDKNIVNNVVVDKDDPLKGRYKGTLDCNVDWNRTIENGKTKQNSLSIKLSDPKMARTSENSDSWELADEEHEKLMTLQKELLGNP